MIFKLRLTLLLVLAAAPTTAFAGLYCVGTPQQLGAAIVAGQLDHRPDVYRLRAGTFELDAPIRVRAFDAQGAHLSGGWNLDCTAQDATPGATVLDGRGQVALLELREPGAPPVEFVLEQLTLRNGRASDVHAVLIHGQNATVRVSRCVFEGNVVSGAGRSVLAIRTGKPIDVLELAFVQNVFSGAAIDLDRVSASQPEGAVRRVIGNTVAFNPAPGAIAIRSGAVATIANNLAWGNATSSDLEAAPGSVVIANAWQHGAPAGNFSVDPLLRSETWRLSGASPLRDQGAGAGVVGRVSAHDLEGEPRVRGAAVDIGADELGPALYADGFE